LRILFDAGYSVADAARVIGLTSVHDDAAAIAAYDRVLASIGDRADARGGRPVVTHWPHVGCAHSGLVIVGQGPTRLAGRLPHGAVPRARGQVRRHAGEHCQER
jgi:hypothetical protein